jgi:hypothetical protein
MRKMKSRPAGREVTRRKEKGGRRREGDGRFKGRLEQC